MMASSSSAVEWSWDSGNGWHTYAAADNLLLETAYQSKKREVKLGDGYKVVFSTMRQMRVDDRSRWRSVKRESKDTANNTSTSMDVEQDNKLPAGRGGGRERGGDSKRQRGQGRGRGSDAAATAANRTKRRRIDDDAEADAKANIQDVADQSEEDEKEADSNVEDEQADQKGGNSGANSEAASPPADSLFPASYSAAPCVYTSDNIFYSAYLEQIDPSINARKFYILQLLQTAKGHGKPKPPAKGKKGRPKAVIRKRKASALDSDAEDEDEDRDYDYVLWTRWGRIGSRGQTQQAAYSTLSGAMKEFNLRFREKTGADWEDREDTRRASTGKYSFRGLTQPQHKNKTKAVGMKDKVDMETKYDDDDNGDDESKEQEEQDDDDMDTEESTKKKTKAVHRPQGKNLRIAAKQAADSNFASASSSSRSMVDGAYALVQRCSADTAAVYSDSDGTYSAYLENIDPKVNACKFYVVQLLSVSDDVGVASGYVLWTRWGRMGSCGQTQVQQFDEGEEEAAKNAFDAKFRDKCGVDWEHRQRAKTKVRGKYKLKAEDIPPFSLPPGVVGDAADESDGGGNGEDADDGSPDEGDAEAVDDEKYGGSANDSSSSSAAGSSDSAQKPSAPSSSSKFLSADRLYSAAASTSVYRSADHVNWSAYLEQIELRTNTSKYYVIQLLKVKGKHSKYVLWTRWGRLGFGAGGGSSSSDHYSDVDAAMKDFEKKFKDKTGFTWADRNEAKTKRRLKYTWKGENIEA